MAIQYVSQKKDQFLQNFQYRVKEWESIFLEALTNTSFEGVTGPVRFYNNERKASFLLKQFQNGIEVKVGEYSSLHNRLNLGIGEPMKWVNNFVGTSLNEFNLIEIVISGGKVSSKRSYT
jgi:gamma-aminobutyric acid type B receptor